MSALSPNEAPPCGVLHSGRLREYLHSQLVDAFDVHGLDQLIVAFAPQIRANVSGASLAAYAHSCIDTVVQRGLLVRFVAQARRQRPEKYTLHQACYDFSRYKLLSSLCDLLGEEATIRTGTVARLHRSCLPVRTAPRLPLGDKHPSECATELLNVPIDPQTRYAPVLAFVRELKGAYPTRAHSLDDWLQNAREWIAVHAGLEPSELSDRPPDAVAGVAWTLVCVVSPEDSRGERWALRSWLYGPPPGPQQRPTIRPLEAGGVLGGGGAFIRDLPGLMCDALDEVADHTPAAVPIDFFVPAALRHEAIDQCPIPAPMTGRTRFLGVEHPLALRCLDRATAAGARRARAAQARRTEYLSSGAVHEFPTARHAEDPSQVLAARHEIAAVLVGEPVPAGAGPEAPAFFMCVIEDGVPVILWSRSGPEPAAVLRDLVAGGLDGLPRRVWEYRRGHPGAASGARLREHLSLMYDPADGVLEDLRSRRAAGPAGRSVQP